MKLKSTIIAAVIAVLPISTNAQVTLPTASVLKKNKVRTIVVRQHNLPSVYVDSSQNDANGQLDQPPFIWAKYWINASGYPDSMYNYMQGIAYRKEVFQYRSKGQLRAINTFNFKNEIIQRETVDEGKQGSLIYRTFSKGQLKAVRHTDKLNRITDSWQLPDARIYGYDSMVYRHDFKADTSTETYYLSGEVSHQLTKKWLGNGPDSFYQSFYQSSPESGRMPSYTVTLPVDESGKLIVPSDLPFGEMFKSLTYKNRFNRYDPFTEELGDLLTHDSLLAQSEIIEKPRPTVTHRHFYTFEYGVE